jgi:arginyl-tRNA synthetase
MRNLLVPVIDDTLTALKQKGALKLAERPSYVVEPPKNAAHGDLSCNVAMVMAKGEGQPPRKIAEAIVAGLVDRAGVIEKVDVAGPGFLNFTLKDAVVQRFARDVLAAGDAWGRASKKTGQRVLVEFVSANPTGPVHIGHARGTFVGDAVARLMDAAGHDVTREFYINDHGNQMQTLGRTVFKRYRQLFGEKVELAEGEYPAEYVVDIAKKLKEEDGDRWLAAGMDAALERCISIAIRENMNAIRGTLAKAKVKHDVFTSEAALHRSGKVLAVVDHYKQRGVTYEADQARGTEGKVRREESKAAQYSERQQGGTFLITSQHGDDEDRIILRKDGSPVYLTADLAYHKDKPRIKAGVELLGVDAKKLQFVLVQIVKIVRGGEEVKLSKRKGTVFELDDLIEEAGADPCRFMFLMKSVNSQFDFDLDLIAKQSKENPVFYFQYGHARCASILRFAADKGQPFVGPAALTDEHLSRLVLAEEKQMLKKMSMLPDLVAGAADALEPHRVLYFCQDLISDFHSYYTKYKSDPIVSEDKVKTQGRLALVAALKQTLKSAFAILGVDAPEEMHRLEEDEA